MNKKKVLDIHLGQNFPGLCREHQFANRRCRKCKTLNKPGRPFRLWRFDWAWPELKIAIEYEGMTGPRGKRCKACGMVKSRHTSVTGYAGDCEKYNNAQLLGWRVYRVTAKLLDQGQTWDFIKEILKHAD